MKSCEAVAKGRKVEGSAAYLMHAERELEQKCSVESPKDWQEPRVLEAALRYAHNLLQQTAEAWQLLLQPICIDLHACVDAHSASTQSEPSGGERKDRVRSNDCSLHLDRNLFQATRCSS